MYPFVIWKDDKGTFYLESFHEHVLSVNHKEAARAGRTPGVRYKVTKPLRLGRVDF